MTTTEAITSTHADVLAAAQTVAVAVGQLFPAVPTRTTVELTRAHADYIDGLGAILASTIDTYRDLLAKRLNELDAAEDATP